MTDRPSMRFVCLRRTQRWFGVVLQKQLRPFANGRVFTLTDDLQNVVVARLEPIAKPLLRLLPIGGPGGFFVPLSGAIPVPHPQKLCALSTVNDAVVFTRSCHSPPPA